MKSLPSQLPIFIQVAKTLSFAAAARSLGVSPPAVSKAISKLEDEWKVKLFYRSTHSLSLTETGLQLFQQLNPSIEAISETLSQVREGQDALVGTIKINLPASSLGQDIVLPEIIGFMDTYPDIICDLHFDDRNLDLVESGFDLAIGTAINQDSRLIARQLFETQIGLFASSDYIKRSGYPSSIADLHSHRCISVRSVTTGRLHGWPVIQGKEEQLFEPTPSLIVNNFSAARQATLLGAGLSCLGSWMVRKELGHGQVLPLLENHWGAKMPVWIYYASRDYVPKRIRRLIDHLVVAFAKQDKR